MSTAPLFPMDIISALIDLRVRNRTLGGEDLAALVFLVDGRLVQLQQQTISWEAAVLSLRLLLRLDVP